MLWRWVWRSLLALTTLLLVVLITTEAGLRSLTGLIGALSGGAVRIGTVSGSLLGPLHLGQCRLSDGIDTVEIEAMHLQWQPQALLQGRFVIDAIDLEKLHINLGPSSTDTLLPPLSLPFPLEVARIQVDEIVISDHDEEMLRLKQGRLHTLLYQGEQLSLAEFTLRKDDSTLRGQGTLQSNRDYFVDASLQADLHLEGYAPITATVQSRGPLNALHLTADMLSPQPMHLEGKLLDILGTTSWSAKLQVPELTPATLHPYWPAQSFRQVAIQGTGNLEEYTLTVAAATGLPGMTAPVALQAELHGNGQGLQCPQLHLSHDTTALRAQGAWQWLPHLAWQAEIQGTNLDPALFIPDWPGRFSGKLITRGQWRDTLEGTLQLTDLLGSLRQMPLSGHGEMQFQGRQIKIPAMTLKSGGSTLSLQGSATDRVEFLLSLHSGNVGELWPGASGLLDIQGRLHGTAQRPAFTLQLDAGRLRAARTSLDRLKVAGKGVFAADGEFQVDAQLNKLIQGDFQLSQALLQAQGTPANHNLKIKGSTQQSTAAGEVLGSLEKSHWLGTLQNIHFENKSLGNWRQQARSKLAITPQRIELQQLCLHAQPDATLCVDGSKDVLSHDWQATASLHALPLSTLTAAVGLPWSLSGSLHSRIQAQGKQQRITSGQVSAETQELRLNTPIKDGALQQLSWQSNRLNASYANDQLQVAWNSQLDAQNTMQASIRQNTSDLLAGLKNRPIKGTVDLHLQNLGLIGALTNQTILPSGTLQAHWSLSGTPLAPSLIGQMDLADGKVEIPALGITLAPLHLTMKGDNTSVHLVASGTSGSGTVQATSTLNLAHGAQEAVQCHLMGENFQAVHLPGLEVTVSPDLNLIASPKHMELRGRLHVPQATLTSVDFDVATPASNDVVFIDEEIAPATAPPLPSQLALHITTGEAVRVDAYGLRCSITGELDIAGHSGRPTTGNGTLTIRDGTYSLYGNRLNIGVGRLLFTGGPLTNPGIELRSEEKTDRGTAGVTVDGFLQRPEITFYSTPVMEQSAILRHLLQTTAFGGEHRTELGMLGTTAKKAGFGPIVPFVQSLKTLSMIDEIKLETGENNEDASLVFGSWLTPDLYVSYGKDLIKESGLFTTRFNLGKGFSLATETGAAQSGGDIKYEFEH